MSTPDLGRVLETVRRALAAAAEVSLRHFGRELHLEIKPDLTPVTIADKESERAIASIIRESFPDDDLLTEESGASGHGADSRWIVDPLDGTRGFVRGGGFWGPLVALEHRGEVLAGGMALPALEETYWAARGMGCFLNGERMRVSDVQAWDEATLSLGELRALLASPHGAAIAELIRLAASARCYGDLAGCAMLLTGRADAWVEAGVKVWDLAPLQVLVEEAGGAFTDFEGRRTIEAGRSVATNGRLQGRVLAALTPSA